MCAATDGSFRKLGVRTFFGGPYDMDPTIRVPYFRKLPEGPTYTTIMELGPQNQNRDGFFGA